MREVLNSTRFALPAAEVWRLLFADARFQEHFHAGAVGASVSAWAAGRRVVTFTKALNLPGPLLRLLGGLSSLNVVEEQEEASAPNSRGGTEWTVLATPISVGLERFKTSVTHTLSCAEEQENGAGAACVLNTRICVSAPAIPGFQCLLEAQMHSVAGSSLAEMYEKAHLYIVDVLAAEAEKAGFQDVPHSPVVVAACAEPACEPMSVLPVHEPLPQPLMRAASSLKRRRVENAETMDAAQRLRPLEALRRSGSLRLRRLTREP